MEINPLHSNVLVRRAEQPETTTGGLYMPTNTDNVRNEGTVLAVGPGSHQNGVFVETTVAVGDQVLFGKYTGDEISVGDDTYLIMPEGSILATIGGSK